MWAVKIVSGAIDTASARLLIDPTSACSAPCATPAPVNFITAAGSTTVSASASLLGFSLASDEHLYVQLWRNQTVGDQLVRYGAAYGDAHRERRDRFDRAPDRERVPRRARARLGGRPRQHGSEPVGDVLRPGRF